MVGCFNSMIGKFITNLINHLDYIVVPCLSLGLYKYCISIHESTTCDCDCLALQSRMNFDWIVVSYHGLHDHI